MAHLEEITVGCQLNGIAARETVTVIAVQWYGNAALEVTFKNSRGQLGSQILYRGDEATVDVLGDSLPWSFGADADKMRLVSEAYRIHLAHLFDPYLAVHTSAIQPLPHQITAVYQEMLPRLPLRYILADDPGAGKTIMTGLFIKELIARGDLKRCLIVTPGNLAEQWQDELFRKFHLRFEVLTNDRIESAVSGNIFTEMNFCIARLDKLSRSEALQEKLRITDWDLIVCDEAHKMSATVWGGEIKYTKRFNLGRLLSEITRNFLLLTATPHNGKNEDFQLFLSLVDPDRFEGAARSSNQSIDVSDVMRRLVKEELLKFDGTPLFPERRAYTVNYDLSPAEGQLYSEVTSYVQEEFNRAENLNNDRKATVGFALTILQRRLASSPEAIYQSLHRRLERLEHILAEEKLGKPDTGTQFTIADDFDEDDFSADDAVAAGVVNDHISLSAGGSGARAYGEAVGVYLAFVIDKMTDYNSSICSWHNSGEKMRNTFGRQAIPMVWDYAEANPFCSSSGSYDNMLDWVVRCIEQLPAQGNAEVSQFDAQSDCGLRNIMVSSDPPYYDNIGYADLSDFFYVWMRQSLKDTYPKLFRTMLVPKAEELVATPYRFEGSTEKARDFFEDGMLHTCQQIYQYAREDIPVTIYYAYKQSDTDEDSKTASTGWETMLSAIIRAGFAITGTWPMCTEMSVRAIAINSNALASSIVLVCRKRPADAPQTTRRGFIAELKRELRPALQKLQRSNIAPVDLAQSAIGPGMGVYSRYGRVLEADGSAMTVRSALQIINQELDVYFNEQDGELDANSRFCVDLYTQNAFNNLKFGDADTLARAKNTSVAALAAKGVLSAEKGIVRLLTREELPEKVDPREESIWLLCQQLTRAMETGGVEACAQIVAPMLGSNAERAKDLAYRLYTLAERKGWTQEGYAYNALVVAWREIQSRAAELQQATPEQTSFF